MIVRHWRVVAVGVLALAGCGKSPTGVAPDEPAPATTTAPDRYNQPFETAVTLLAPEGANPPPAATLAGRSTAQVHTAVREAWPTVSVTTADGKPEPIVVAVQTDAGPVEITLFPELAPNHVRNFLALATVGYYDGLAFERVIRQEFLIRDAGGAEERQEISIVTAGCPAGDGDPAHGHLGYFLPPEPNALKHEEGTVGFLQVDDPRSASCRIYICLQPTPIFDGAITAVGKVTGGLETVKAIAARPVKDPARPPGNEQPRDPVKIRSVTRK